MKLSMQLLASSIALSSPAFADNTTRNNTQDQAQLDTVSVSADFRQLDLMQIPSAITVVDEDTIQQRNADHLERILSLAPNVNFAAGASRGRYFQIRGIGERSQFIDSVNPSVGLIIDGIDMTGLGGAATLFDIEQVEILRGPQGTTFGANALAGAINIKSKQPTKETQGYVSAKAGNYNSQGLGGAISGSLNDNLQGRFAINQFTSDGYMENDFLNRSDTSNIDETVARGQLAWQINEHNQLNVSLLKADIDNGYDAFTIDNSFITQSDQPGKDKLNSRALAVNSTHNNSSFIIETVTQASSNDTFYSYDYDWMNIGFRTNGISDYEEFDRTTNKGSLDLRLLSQPQSNIFNNTTSWTTGIYTQSFDEELSQKRIGDYGNSDFQYETSRLNVALYTELDSLISNVTSITYGLRIENTSVDFDTSKNYTGKQSELLYGGKLALEHALTAEHLTYISLNRGYKAGGFNSDPNAALPSDLIKYETEYNWATEIGLKTLSLDNTFSSRVALFHIYRDNQQVKSSTVRDNGATFIDSFTNAASGYSYGAELETNWEISSSITWNTSVGLLETEINDFAINIDTDGDWVNDTVLDKSGRAQAHAPSYSLSTQVTVNINKNISSNIEIEAKDDFYFSDSHDAKSAKYALLNASIHYKTQDIELSLAAKNITDEKVETRGFSGWIQDPLATITPNKYVQFGNPRLITLQARYNF